MKQFCSKQIFVFVFELETTVRRVICAYRMVPIQMTLSDLWGSFQLFEISVTS